MTLLQRIGYYLGGFSIGLVILAFFLSGKKTSCSYGPDARVLKNIQSKKVIYTDNTISELQLYNLDSSAVNHVLKRGNINFSESDTRKEPCGMYVVEGNFNKKEIILSIENCDSIATITNFRLKN